MDNKQNKLEIHYVEYKKYEAKIKELNELIKYLKERRDKLLNKLKTDVFNISTEVRIKPKGKKEEKKILLNYTPEMKKLLKIMRMDFKIWKTTTRKEDK